MRESLPVRIFLDTNSALHFKRPDQIDWCALTKSKDVVLVAAPILCRELEQQKVHNASRKLRERATDYLKWLVTFVRDPNSVVRPAVKWEFITDEPSINFEANSLSPLIADDHLLASVIAYAKESVAKVYVATADTGLEVKLRARGIEHLMLPESARLPEESDPIQTENRELRRQLAQRREPKVKLLTGISGGRFLFSIVSQPIKLSAISLDQIQEQHPPLCETDETPPGSSTPPFVTARLLRSALLPPELVAQYNEQRERYFTSYRTYLDRLAAWEEQKAATVEVQLSATNEGTAPASDIDIVLWFPDDVILMSSDDLPARPVQPDPPERPNSFFSDFASQIARSRHASADLYLPDLDLVTHGFNSHVEVNSDEHQVGFWIRALKHGSISQLDSVYFRFTGRASVRNFTVRYEISAAELPERINGELHFVQSKAGTE